MKKIGKWIAFLTIGLLLAAGIFVGAQTLLDPYDCRIVENVSIGGLDVGGMTRKEAKAALESAARETLLSKDLKITLPKETLVIAPDDAQLKLSASKAVSAAYRIGRTGTAEEKAAAAASEHALGLIPYLQYSEEALRGILQGYADRYDTQLSQFRYELKGEKPELSVDAFDPSAPCQTLEITLGVPEVILDVEGILQDILTLYDQAFAAINTNSYTLRPVVVPSAVPELPDWEAIYAELCTEPVDDSLDMETYQPVPGSYGYRFDVDNAKYKAFTGKDGTTVSIPMEYVEPEILGEEVYFRDVLGFCDTKHNTDEMRNNNLRLVCQILDGYILQPGDAFSFNGVVGERTPERGFQPAPAYSGNRLIKDYGGGVCQTSSTLYNCVLLADFEVTDRVCHGITVSYLPLGLDAAVNWATKTDMAFINTSHFPVMIRAEVSDGYVRMKLLGTDEKDYYIEMRSTRGEDEHAIYSVSYKFKYSKETGELISKDQEARSTYYKDLG